MWPFHFRLGPLALSPVELFAFLGFGLVVLIAGRIMIRDQKISRDALLDLAIGALVGGSLGARLYYAVPMWLRGQLSFGAIFTQWADGSGYYGAFLGGTLGILATARFKGIPGVPVIDVTAWHLALGFAGGKIGCFLAGCCYGTRTDGPLGVRFVPGSLCYQTHLKEGKIARGASGSLPVHAAQFYELALGFLLFGLLTILARRPDRRPGELWCGYAIGYSAWRFTIEFFRDDPGRHAFGGNALTDSQITALVVACGAALLWVWTRLRKPAVPAPGTPIQ